MTPNSRLPRPKAIRAKHSVSVLIDAILWSQHMHLSTEAWSQIHALTSQDRVVMDQMRAVVEPNKGKLRGVGARAPYEAIMGRVAAPDGVTFRPDKIGGIVGWWCEPVDAKPSVVSCICTAAGSIGARPNPFAILSGTLRGVRGRRRSSRTTDSLPKIPSLPPSKTSTPVTWGSWRAARGRLL
jgi:hypothetical protein